MRLIRLPEVINLTGLSRSSIYKYISEKTFPQSVSLGERACAWVESEVQEWVLARIAERDQALGAAACNALLKEVS
ncbi:helix-turn-helix transcriptional regulator [Pseudomonas sp. TTU2014-080ASC]|uniref:helix-turn-helix transcriptional regulator n=1 Tax=Pseudomonas sp. TTU2014-080ASC TaxID=1729724 RepID=UPI0007184A1A|nr:AlpA family transcriptional regulator [Pseudomonas sp. TTU2014-080ASC]KRW58565.1 hypothetical protein AO726_17150 [Pseudomonas sp. TTU2014-080ASC]